MRDLVLDRLRAEGFFCFVLASRPDIATAPVVEKRGPDPRPGIDAAAFDQSLPIVGRCPATALPAGARRHPRLRIAVFVGRGPIAEPEFLA